MIVASISALIAIASFVSWKLYKIKNYFYSTCLATALAFIQFAYYSVDLNSLDPAAHLVIIGISIFAETIVGFLMLYYFLTAK